MNKILLPILLFAISLGVVSCRQNERGFSLTDISNPTASDSLMYYLGQIRAVKYWKDAENDSTLHDPDAKEDYMEGMKDALKALGKSDAYMMGLLEGAQQAENISTYANSYGMKFNPDIMIRSMYSALQADSVDNLPEIRKHFYAIRNAMEQDRDERDTEHASAALTKAAEQLGMTRLTPDLWKKILVNGTGDKVERGDRIGVAMQMTTIDGHKIPIHLPTQLVLGGRVISTVFTDAGLSMRYGETSEFATTALAIFGSHAAQLDLKPETVLIIKIAVLGEIDSSDSSLVNP